ncbi:DUF1642 domain-containing protein [Streptococcus salivarius]|uniref:DUF1642 domain-containing protein n=1 Tax=Streptococcus salivarius TaxID=1304 RepID=A0AAW6D0F0_STRSL|nr:DUF1642 domain-containing protein [Streptococcus salivarius]MDB8613087.1 DUF1642 domain-containing protein [Streptococcus salivarius]
MDRQEAIQTLSKVGKISVSYAEDLYDSFFPRPVVPQYVADWLEYCKFTNVNLGRALFISDIDFYNYESQEDCSKLKEFLGTETNQEIFARAWLDGYEVEKEARYTVKIKGLTSKRSYLNYLIDDDRWYLNDEVSSVAARTQHTRKELEQGGFGEVFDNPMFEVKEVTDE